MVRGRTSRTFNARTPLGMLTLAARLRPAAPSICEAFGLRLGDYRSPGRALARPRHLRRSSGPSARRSWGLEAGALAASSSSSASAGRPLATWISILRPLLCSRDDARPIAASESFSPPGSTPRPTRTTTRPPSPGHADPLAAAAPCRAVGVAGKLPGRAYTVYLNPTHRHGDDRRGRRVDDALKW